MFKKLSILFLLIASIFSTALKAQCPNDVDFVNVQFPTTSQTITVGDNLNVFAQAYEAGVTETAGDSGDIEAWIGYNTTNTNPNTWTNWIVAPYNTQSGNNDEYFADLGAAISASGTYYFASRFRVNGCDFTFGGSGGIWNNDSVQLNVLADLVDFCNVDFPKNGNIAVGSNFSVFAQAFESGVTDSGGQGANLEAWIGYNTIGENYAPDNTTNWTWVAATYNLDQGNNDQYEAEIGSSLTTGTYYFASRWRLNGSDFTYGGIQADNVGNFWDATNNSGTLIITQPNIALSPSVMNGFNYDTGNGPSAEQIAAISGINLASPITLNAPTNYEISLTSGSGFGLSLNLNPTNGTVGSTNIYIRLAAGLTVGNYTGNITATSTSATTRSIALSGSVIIPDCSELFFSEYIEGSGNNKYLEIYNPTGSAISLNGYDVQIYSNGNISPSTTITLTITNSIAAYGTYILGNSGGSIVASPDQTNGSLAFNGDDAIVLRNAGTIIDAIGQIGFDPGSEWSGSTCTLGTENATLVRNSNIQAGDADAFDTFDPDTEWTCFAQDNVSDTGIHANDCLMVPELQLEIPVANAVNCGITYDFGTQSVNFNTDQVIRISNLGSIDLDISGLALTTATDFTLVSPPATPFTITSGNFVDITVRFNTSTIGLVSDTLTITSNDADEGNCTINFTAIGDASCATSTNIIAAQNFESAASDTWNFTPDHAEIVNFWYVTNALSAISSAQNSSNFFGMRDLERAGHNGLTHDINFSSVSVSGLSSVELSFYYYTTGVDASDAFDYELFYDSVSQGIVDISANTDSWTNVIISIPDAVNNIEIRFYADLDAGNDQAGIDNFVISNQVADTATWDGSNWVWNNGNPIDTLPSSTTNVIIEDSYTGPSFSACTLTVNNGASLTVGNGNFVEVLNDVTVNDGNITTQTQGSFVQRGEGASAGAFTLGANGASVVNKTTSPLTNWYDLTYWSSPVVDESTDGALFPSSRVFWFNANNYLDANGDSLDDDANAWTRELGDFPMTPGQGFAASHTEIGFMSGNSYSYIFDGAYNTGDITYPIINDAANGLHWNLIGNPYPSAIDVDAFFAENGTVAPGNNTVYEVLYMWSQVNPVDEANVGNEVLNYNQNDYITINAIGEAGNGTTAAPSRQVPSGQAFFVPSASTGNVLFTNSMRVSGDNSNNEFYRTTSSTTSANNSIEKLNINLSSDIGIYSQICVAYADFATDGYDGNAIDTYRNYAGNAGLLYSLDSEGTGFYVIQGKALSGLNEDETIQLGFGAYISTNETYTISAVKREGAFMSSNPVYIKDNDLGITHDLTTSDYTFTSDGGNFEERFEIAFKQQALSVDENVITENSLSIIELSDDNVKFSLVNNQIIDTVKIYDIQGKLIYDLEGNNNTEIYNLANLSAQIYVAKVTLKSGQTISKKAIKK